MKNTNLLLLGLFFCLAWLSSCQEDKSEAEKALCECVQTTETGQWDMSLTPECMQRCMEFFGPELEGMETWFRENCGYDFSHPEVDKEPATRI